MSIESSGVQQILDAVRINRQNIAAYSSLGNIRVTAHPCEPLLIFNYTEKATSLHSWIIRIFNHCY